MNKQELIDELRYSLPSKRMLEVTNNLAVRHPITGEFIHLKQRPNFENTPLSEYICYDKRQDIMHNYNEILGKSVIVDNNLLNRIRAEEVFIELSKISN